jgi:hypothetical protein
VPNIATLRDDFQDNAIAAAWSTAVSGSATVAETAGQARITLPSSTAGSHQGYYRSTGVYDLTGDGCYLTVDTMVATGVAATMFFDLFVDTLNVLRWTQTSGTIKAQTIVGGVATDRFSASWSSTNHKYLRIREAGGSILFDTSANGTSWTNRATVAAPFAVTGLFIQFGALCGNVAAPGSFRVEQFNTILPALSTTWRWSEGQRPTEITRIGSITLSATSGQGYLATAEELDASGVLVSPRFFAGPIGSTSGGYLALTEYTSEAAAQAMAVNLPTNGRWDLPGFVQASVVRLHHRSITGASYRIDEFYPRRLTQSDDMEAESITAINIAADAIQARHIAAHQITADHIDVLDLDATSYITAGGRKVRLDDEGMTIESGTALENAIKWRYTDASLLAQLTVDRGTDTVMKLQALSPVSGESMLQLVADLYGFTAISDGDVSVYVGGVGKTFNVLTGVSGIPALGLTITASGLGVGGGSDAGRHVQAERGSAAGRRRSVLHRQSAIDRQ